MEPLQTGLIVAALMMAGALAGAILRKRLSEKHFDEETQDIVKLGLGFLATLAPNCLRLCSFSSTSCPNCVSFALICLPSRSIWSFCHT